jgi:hypothetical protein
MRLSSTRIRFKEADPAHRFPTDRHRSVAAGEAIVFLAEHTDEEYISAAFGADARGYVATDSALTWSRQFAPSWADVATSVRRLNRSSVLRSSLIRTDPPQPRCAPQNKSDVNDGEYDINRRQERNQPRPLNNLQQTLRQFT